MRHVGTRKLHSRLKFRPAYDYDTKLLNMKNKLSLTCTISVELGPCEKEGLDDVRILNDGVDIIDLRM